MSALEAMASEVPVIGTRAGGLPEVVVEGEPKPVELKAELDGANLIIALADTGAGKLLVTTQAVLVRMLVITAKAVSIT